MQVIGATSLRAIILGRPTSGADAGADAGADTEAEAGAGAGDGAERLAFYCEVMGLPPGPVVDLGPGGPEVEAVARGVMDAFGQVPAPRVRQRLPSLRVAAASRLRAAAGAARDLRAGAGDVTVTGARQAHAGFFGLEVLTLRHRRFDGSMSPVLQREVFVAGDAVTVLPYDPVRDRVLVVEQVRIGPLGRGDPWPWQLEAVAGRIDPGETPEAAAHREAVEEAGLTLGALHRVAEYYPSPGAVTEYIYSYVGLCDLPDDAAGVFGAEDEAEDIRGHLLSFDALMAAVARGEITNAPLLLTAFWLQREKARLR